MSPATGNKQQKPSRVFITQQPKPNFRGWTPNLTPAKKYGDLHFIFAPLDRVNNDPDAALMLAEEALDDFNPLSDYILWPNGVDPFSIWAVLIVLNRKGITQLKGLHWERRMRKDGRDPSDGYYTPVVFKNLDRLSSSLS